MIKKGVAWRDMVKVATVDSMQGTCAYDKGLMRSCSCKYNTRRIYSSTVPFTFASMAKKCSCTEKQMTKVCGWHVPTETRRQSLAGEGRNLLFPFGKPKACTHDQECTQTRRADVQEATGEDVDLIGQ